MTPQLPFIINITIEGTLVKDKPTTELDQILKESAWDGVQQFSDNIWGSISHLTIHAEVKEEWIDGRFRGDYRE